MIDKDHAAAPGIVAQPAYALINDGETPLLLPEAGLDAEQWRTGAAVWASHQRLLGLLQRELATLALFLSISTSYANFALAHSEQSPRMREKCRQFFPNNYVSLNSVLAMVAQSPVESVVVDKSMELLARMRLAEACFHGPAVDRGEAEIAALASQLSSLCLDFVNIHRELDAALGSTGQRITSPTTGLLSSERLAFVAAHGGWPCIDESGHVAVPGWFERRDNARFKTNITCQLLSDGPPADAVIEDISSIGAGLCIASTLEQGRTIRLLLPNGTGIDGDVEWQTGTRCGIRFLQQLTSDHLRMIRTIPVHSAS